MNIEAQDTCSHDSVAVYDGNDDQAPLIGRYCGNTIPAPVSSQGSAMYVVFTSDASTHLTGFRATFTKSVSSKYLNIGKVQILDSLSKY